MSDRYRLTWVSRLALAIPLVVIVLPPTLAEPASPQTWSFVAVLVIGYLALWGLIGRTELVIDDRGVWRKGVFSSRALLWDEIVGYAYSANPRGRGAAATGGAIATAVAAAATPRWGKATHIAYQLTIDGADGRSLRITSGFQRADQAVAAVLARVHPGLLAAARARIAAGERVQLGPLTISATGVELAGKPRLSPREIEKVDIFPEGGSTRLRIIKAGKAWPYASLDVRKLRGAPIALDLFRDLGVPVEVPGWYAP